MGETLIRHFDKGTYSICEVPKIKQELQGARTMSSADQTESNNTAVSSPTERRHHLRFPFSATVEAVEIKSGTKITGRTSDLGLGGCYVDTLSPFPVGTETKIRILRENESFEAHAKVVYSLIGMGMGLAFVSAQAKQIRLFQRWLQEISGQPVSAEDGPSHQASETAPAEKTQTLKNVVLSDLIMTLMQKKVLTEREGKDLLRKLFV
jgi:PilZ domain